MNSIVNSPVPRVLISITDSPSALNTLSPDNNSAPSLSYIIKLYAISGESHDSSSSDAVSSYTTYSTPADAIGVRDTPCPVMCIGLSLTAISFLSATLCIQANSIRNVKRDFNFFIVFHLKRYYKFSCCKITKKIMTHQEKAVPHRSICE